MRRRISESDSREEPTEDPGRAAVSATVRKLEDGSLALVVTAGDADLLEAAARGRPLLVRVEPGTDTSRARTELARGLRAFADGPVSDAYASLILAATLAARGPAADPRLALTAILAAADAAWQAGDRAACLAALGAAETALDGTGRSRQPLYDHLIGLRALIEERPAEAAGPLHRVLAHARGSASPEALHRAAIAALLLGDVESACRMGEHALAAVRADDARAEQILEYLAYAEMRAGRHAPARAHAAAGLQAALQSGHSNSAAHHRAVLALTAAVEGDTDEVIHQAEPALATARRHGLAQTRTLAEWALARADLGRGRPEAAAARLAGLLGAEGGHFAIRSLLMPCFVEAAVLAGRVEDARPVAEEFGGWEKFGVDRAATAQLARCRALLAAADAADDVDDRFRAALELHADEPDDYERARTRLHYGKWLRRRRRPREARIVLREALHGFERCGAAAWAEQCRVELRASGEPARTATPVRSSDALASLTPHQLRIAEHVATGATNREVAQRLSVSVRTVDHHLRNIFAALGIRSRVELARLVDRS